jgi:hypothetical protein
MLQTIGILLILGVLAAAIQAVPWIDAGFKRVIQIIIVVIAALWLISKFFGVNLHSI